MDYKKVHDEITEAMARGLHYCENIESISKMLTANDVNTAISGGIDRYRQDPAYRAKVQMLVASVMEIVVSNNHGPTGT